MNSNHFDEDEGLPLADENGYTKPSKSALKRQSHELQDLGEQLLAMPDARLAAIDMPERLRDALAAYKTTRSFEGKRRQLQYIGKVIRGVDAEPLREAVASFQLGHAQNALSLHEAERWRAELLADEKSGPGTLGGIISRHGPAAIARLDPQRQERRGAGARKAQWPRLP